LNGALKTETNLLDGPDAILRSKSLLESIFRFPAAVDAVGLPQRKFHVISQGDQPRWIVPENNRSALTVFKSWRPYGTKSRLQWHGVIAASSMNLLPLLPEVKTVEMNCNLPYWKTQLNGLSAEWEILGHVGNPSPTQKAIFFFLDKDSVRAVAKIPLSVQAKAAILNEAAILRRVKAQYIVPEVLFTDEEHGVVAQSWMQGRHISRRFREEHLDFLLGLGCNGCTIRLSDFRNALATQLSCFDRPKTEMQGIEQALSLLENDEELMAFIEHRDFAPWNIRRLADGKITLIDWEWAVENSLPWQDICRYFYIQDYLFNESKNVWDILTSNALLQTYARKCRLSKEALRGLTSYYLLRTLFEDWTEGQHKRCAYTLRQIQFLLHS